MRYFLVGIGGIGMSALAQFLVSRGEEVMGSDRDSSPTTDMLEGKGIKVVFGHYALPADIECLVYSDAIPRENPERTTARERGIPEYSYFEMLGMATAHMRTIAVAGTHGKTTVTGMLAKLLVDAQVHPTAVVGSIVRDFGSNFVAGTSDVCVVEACEYKNHLLHLLPEVLVLTNVELDHTDFFPDLASLQRTFQTAIERVPAHGAIVTDTTSETIAPLLHAARARVIDYTHEDVPPLLLPGEFNAANARAATAAARVVVPSLTAEQVYASLAHFHGSWRRFEYKGEMARGVVVYDDYAHHPTAVQKTIEAAHARWPDKKIVVAFHPHLYSRTKQFMDAFATALAHADAVVLAPIYAAREAHDSSVTSGILAEKIRALGTPATAYDSLDGVRDGLLSAASTYAPSSLVIITMGAGDIYKVAEQLLHTA